jgi:hypothetical protein
MEDETMTDPTPTRWTVDDDSPRCTWGYCSTDAVAEYGLVKPDQPVNTVQRWSRCCKPHIEIVSNVDWLTGVDHDGEGYVVVVRILGGTGSDLLVDGGGDG